MKYGNWAYAAGLMVLASILASSTEARAESVTFAKDVAPIFQKNCQECHRPGESTPMSLLTYQDARPWAKKIQEVVASRIMPPWHADPSIGHFSNDRRLSQSDIDTIVAWVDQGVAIGNPADLPAPLEFAKGWKIGEPDVVFEMSRPMELPAALEDEYRYVSIPTGFTEDRWIQAAECRPGNVDVVHHIIAFVQAPGASGRGGLESGLGGYAPGLQPAMLPDGEAMFLPAGSTIVFQLHYHKEPGMAAADQSKIGLRFARTPVHKKLTLEAAGNRTFVIPPGDPNYEVVAEEMIAEPIHMQSITPHMHLRGKDMKVWAELPDGTVKDLVWVPKYDFNWQTSYEFNEPIALPAGTKIVAKAHFDNSANNPANPDPNAEIRWGLPTTAEMMFAFYSMTSDQEHLDVMDPAAAKELAKDGEGAMAGGE